MKVMLVLTFHLCGKQGRIPLMLAYTARNHILMISSTVHIGSYTFYSLILVHYDQRY